MTAKRATSTAFQGGIRYPHRTRFARYHPVILWLIVLLVVMMSFMSPYGELWSHMGDYGR